MSIRSVCYAEPSFTHNVLTHISPHLCQQDQTHLKKVAVTGDVFDLADIVVMALGRKLFNHLASVGAEIRCFGEERLKDPFNNKRASLPWNESVGSDFYHETPVVEVVCTESSLGESVGAFKSLETTFEVIQREGLEDNCRILEQKGKKVSFRWVRPSLLDQRYRERHGASLLAPYFGTSRVSVKSIYPLYKENQRPSQLIAEKTFVHGSRVLGVMSFWHDELHRAVLANRQQHLRDVGFEIFKAAIDCFNDEVESYQSDLYLDDCFAEFSEFNSTHTFEDLELDIPSFLHAQRLFRKRNRIIPDVHPNASRFEQSCRGLIG